MKNSKLQHGVDATQGDHLDEHGIALGIGRDPLGSNHELAGATIGVLEHRRRVDHFHFVSFIVDFVHHNDII